jgi:hypothetical protein
MSDTWVWSFGELGKTMRGQLRDGAGAVDLSQYSGVAWTAKRSETGTAFTGLPLAVTPDVNQSTEVLNAQGHSVSGKGWFTFVTNSTSAAVPVSTGAGHLLSFVGTDGAGPHYYPITVRSEQGYARLVVQAVP